MVVVLYSNDLFKIPLFFWPPYRMIFEPFEQAVIMSKSIWRNRFAEFQCSINICQLILKCLWVERASAKLMKFWLEIVVVCDCTNQSQYTGQTWATFFSSHRVSVFIVKTDFRHAMLYFAKIVQMQVSEKKKLTFKIDITIFGLIFVSFSIISRVCIHALA